MLDLTSLSRAALWTRRAAFGAALSVAAGGTLLALSSGMSAAQQKKGPAEVPVEELMKAGDLAETAIGAADAKITVVEYGSMTCGHCANR